MGGPGFRLRTETGLRPFGRGAVGLSAPVKDAQGSRFFITLLPEPERDGRDTLLGTVVNGQGIMRSEIVREEANIPDSEVIMTCIALGYPNEDFAANTVKADREPNEHFVRYVGFED